MKKIINFLKNWFTGEWDVKKYIITMAAALAIILVFVTIFAISIHLLKILGSMLIVGGVLGATQRIKKGFSQDKIRNIISISVFGILVIIGLILMFI